MGWLVDADKNQTSGTVNNVGLGLQRGSFRLPTPTGLCCKKYVKGIEAKDLAFIAGKRLEMGPAIPWLVIGVQQSQSQRRGSHRTSRKTEKILQSSSR